MPARKKEESPLVETGAMVAEQEAPGVTDNVAVLWSETTIYGLWSPSLQLWWPPQAAHSATVFHTPHLGVAHAQLRNVLSARNGGYRRDWVIQQMVETPGAESASKE
jgi:hypothetical protein